MNGLSDKKLPSYFRFPGLMLFPFTSSARTKQVPGGVGSGQPSKIILFLKLSKLVVGPTFFKAKVVGRDEVTFIELRSVHSEQPNGAKNSWTLC